LVGGSNPSWSTALNDTLKVACKPLKERERKTESKREERGERREERGERRVKR
jgi:hypothetical protein